ncbi:MAG TPA: PQQ-binding-like beta-propeller repeat protein [Lacipirellulaceae bacterium]
MKIRTGKLTALSIGSVLITFCLAIGLQFARAQRGPFGPENPNRSATDGNDTNSGVYLPTDRLLSRAMARAQERLTAGEYHQSLGFLHQIFQREEDSFLEPSETELDHRGLKAAARQMIRALPAAGHEAYELLHGAAARRQLDAALASGDQDRIASVVRQYFHTGAGYEAALVLAQMEADKGNYLAAGRLYQELLESPRASERFEPQLSVRAALNQVAESRPDLAVTILRALVEKHPTALIDVEGEGTPAPRADADLLAWLLEQVGQPRATVPTQPNWLTIRGNPQRNAKHPDGRPHLRPRWQARVVNDPGLESHFVARSEEFAQRRLVTFPAARPIAVDDVVVMRTPRNLVAIDWDTGKRIWETRDDEEFESDDSLSEFSAGNEGDQLTGQDTRLERRMWDDALAMSLSSDGKRVFVVRGVSAPSQEEIVAWQAGPGFGRRVDNLTATSNQLAAYDLATEGKLAWELDGARPSGPVAGAFFLGTPLAVGNTLYVMAEIRSAVYLLALDPATGKVKWQQQLVGLEQGIALEPARRLFGATPSHAGSLVICPTAAGAIVAVDIVKREFAWVYRYARNIRSPMDAMSIWQQQPQNQVVRANNRWLDGTAILADGRVVVTPPDSDELHCLDMQTGKGWKQRRGDALLAACADGGNVLLVAGDDVQALRLADGTSAWEQQSLPADALPGGHGYLSDGAYYLPLTNGEILSIGMADGKLDRLAAGKPDAAFGNLICHRGSVISQSTLLLDKYEQLDVLRRRTQQTLAEDPNDATALRELAELKRTEGQTSEAVTLLKRAYELAPSEPLTREVLAELLLEALAADYAAFDDNLPLLTELVRDRQQQIELMRIEALGLDKLGQRLDAWAAYLRLADFTAEQPEHLRIDSDYSVRSDRWIGGRVAALWSNATRDEQASIASQLAARRANVKDPETTAELRHYLAHFDKLPGSNEVRNELIELLSKRGRLAEAEIEQLQLPVAGEDGGEAAAHSAITALSQDANLPQWPTGKVIGDVKSVASGSRDRAERAQVEQLGYRQLRIEQDVPAGPTTQWFVSGDYSELVGRNPLGDDIYRIRLGPTNWAQQYRDSNLVYAARLGHLLIASLGGQILAIDSRQNQAGLDGTPLWQATPFGRIASEGLRGRRGARVRAYRTTRRSPYHASSSRKRNSSAAALLGSLGPVTARGVIYQEQNQLKCVDPLNGETLWLRTDIPAGCELFGDDEYVFAADLSARKAHVLRLSDGQLLGKRDLPKFEWLMTVGRNLATLGSRTERGNRASLVQVVDIWSQETLFEADYPPAAQISVVEPDCVAICDPSGRFQLINVRTGQAVVNRPIDAVPELRGIQTLRSGDSIFVMLNRQAQNQQHKPLIHPEHPITDGPVYAFNLKTGQPMWPSAALVRNRAIALSQPLDLPMLVFAEHMMTRDPSTSDRMQLRLLCLDKRTGETVYRNDNLPQTSASRFRIRAQRGADPRVTIETGSSKIELAVTDEPKPPQPPANDELESAREVGRRGLLGLGERMLRGAISDPAAERQRLIREVPPQKDDD